MAGFKPVKLSVSGISLVITLPEGLIPTKPPGDAARHVMAYALHAMLPTDVVKRLDMPKNGVEFYEYGHEPPKKDVMFVIHKLPDATEVKGPWEVGFYLDPLLTSLRPLGEACAAAGLEAKLRVAVAAPQFEEWPCWFTVAVLQFQPVVEIELQYQLGGDTLEVNR